ncbi:MAG TPA: mismatch-specific DNA-glycosylase [Ilumatobacteraceae bacterium]|nr:mismatch-specific DNA-glycosylase [Ilumatobacteraceae bacterium]
MPGPTSNRLGQRTRATFTRAELAAWHGAAVDDLVDERVRILFVGINPGLWTAAVNAHFARRGNRFWPALHTAGITPRLVDVSDGMNEQDRELVLGLGIGITNIVSTASARADELSLEELHAGAQELEAKVRRWKPRVVAVLGLTAYRQAFAKPKAVQGRQEDRLGDAELWVLPNPSGLNAHETIDSLARSYRRAWEAAISS